MNSPKAPFLTLADVKTANDAIRIIDCVNALEGIENPGELRRILKAFVDEKIGSEALRKYLLLLELRASEGAKK